MDYIFLIVYDAPVFVQACYLLLLAWFIYGVLSFTGFWAKFSNHPKRWSTEKCRIRFDNAIKNDDQKMLKWFMHEDVESEFQLEAIRSIKDEFFLRRYTEYQSHVSKAAAETLGGKDLEKYKMVEKIALNANFSVFLSGHFNRAANSHRGTLNVTGGNILDSGYGNPEALYEWLEKLFDDPFKIDFSYRRDSGGTMCLVNTLDMKYEQFDPQMDQYRTSISKDIWICPSREHIGYEWTFVETYNTTST